MSRPHHRSAITTVSGEEGPACVYATVEALKLFYPTGALNTFADNFHYSNNGNQASRYA